MINKRIVCTVTLMPSVSPAQCYVRLLHLKDLNVTVANTSYAVQENQMDNTLIIMTGVGSYRLHLLAVYSFSLSGYGRVDLYYYM